MNKVVKILIICFVIFAIVLSAYSVIYPKLCNISIGISVPVNPDGQYLEDFILIYNHIPESKIPQLEELSDTKNDFRMNFFDEHKEDDYHIEIDFTFENGKTIVTYEGTITDKETGETVPFEKEFVHDFILTKDIH